MQESFTGSTSSTTHPSIVLLFSRDNSVAHIFPKSNPAPSEVSLSQTRAGYAANNSIAGERVFDLDEIACTGEHS